MSNKDQYIKLMRHQVEYEGDEGVLYESSDQADHHHESKCNANAYLVSGPTLVHKKSYPSSIFRKLYDKIILLILALLALLLLYHAGRFYVYLIDNVESPEFERPQYGINSTTKATSSIVSTNAIEIITTTASPSKKATLQTTNIEPTPAKSKEWFVFNSQCHIPALDPWDASIGDRFDDLVREIKCPARSAPDISLTLVRDNLLYLNEEAITRYNKNLSDCCYMKVTRLDGDDDLTIDTDCVPITGSGISVPHKWIKVQCNREKYTNVHSFVTPLDNELQIDELMRKNVDINSYSNVLIVGLDTVSRSNSIRQLNRTLSIIERIFGNGIDNNDAWLDFKGYNKVGENTFPNIIPLLTGHTPEELVSDRKHLCWHGANYSNEKIDQYIDKCGLLWSRYASNGYRTYYHEDWAKASTFNYLKPGFDKQPTDFYQRPFYLLEKDLNSDIGMSCAECIHDQPIVDINLKHLSSFLHAYKHRPYFVYNWLNCPQHEATKGAARIDDYYAKFFESIYELVSERTFVLFMSDHGWRYNSFASTYAGKFESALPMLRMYVPRQFRAQHRTLFENLITYQNALITPFDLHDTLADILKLSLRSSAQAQHRHPEQTTQQSTTTTIPDDEIGDDQLRQQQQKSETKRAVSQKATQKDRTTFSMLSVQAHHNPSINRTCEEAGIPDNYCVCHQMEPVNANENYVKAASHYLVERFNRRLVHTNHSKLCSKLRLASTLKAKRRIVGNSANDDDDDDENSADSQAPNNRTELILTIKTEPGGGEFEEVVRVYGEDLDECGNKYRSIVAGVEAVTKHAKDTTQRPSDERNLFMLPELEKVCKFRVTGKTIARLNAYGNTSACVKIDAELRKICYCKHQTH